MAETRAAWGIDIGQSGLKALKLRHLESTNQVVAEAFDYIQFPKILSQPDAIPEEIVPQAMETFLARNDLKGDLVAISVPGQSALSRFIQLPPVESSKLHEIVKYEARQQIPFPLDEVIWDYQPLGAGSQEGGFLLDAEVGLFAMKRDQINQQLRPYQNAKVEVELIQIAPLALYNVLSYDEMGIERETEGEPGDEYYIVLDMGCDNTTLMVSNGYKIWIRNVPIGGNHFTRALTKEMKLSFAKAEHLKCNATKAPDPRAVFQALRPVFNDYVAEIQRSVGYFSSVNRSAKVVKVIGLGNGFKLAGLQKFLQQNLQYEVERPDSFNALAGDAVVNSPLFAENLLSFAVPYGLGLQALGLSRIQTSLLPPEIKTARLIRRKKPWALATAAVVLVGLSISTAVNAYSYSYVAQPAFSDVETEANNFKKQVGDFTSRYQTEQSKFSAIQSKLKSFTENRRDVHWMEIYNAVLACLPRDPVDAEISYDEPEKRNVISLTYFGADRVADLSTWFSSLQDWQLENMKPEDRESGPSGEGYVFTVQGQHWHHNPENHNEMDVTYVRKQFLEKLQQQVVQPEGYPPYDVGRLGISHAVIVDYSMSTVPRPDRPSTIRPDDPTPRFSLIQPGRSGGSSGEGLRSYLNDEKSGNAPTTSSGTQDSNMLHQTDFKIQFVVKYIPPEERPEIAVTAPAEETPSGAVQ